ncbi:MULTISPECIES: phage tail assembly chaperone [unclassified Aurantimonas]|uniref:phage tail assembly chaperone n=1 Tax=unclassified Aurantimonas TaxID=2638230 RepID=UPI002E183CDD|nr:MULTISPECIES: hypothetical protein [unclassified Aurantimonas]MEC5289383.1 hypothetical protein [Aurantimonas sp. C2-3-R2]MEC5410463.1 hypothetical protein [Aurantimonas sp. C2-4-R8]
MAEKKIAGRLFRIQQPLAREALALQFRVMNLLGGSATELPKAIEAMQAASAIQSKYQGQNAPTVSDEDMAKLSAANSQIIGVVMGILGNMKPEAGVSFLADMVAMAEVKAANGQYEQADIDTEFSTDPTGLYEVVGFVLKEVLGPFISGLMGSMSAKKGAAALARGKSGE